MRLRLADASLRPYCTMVNRSAPNFTIAQHRIHADVLAESLASLQRRAGARVFRQNGPRTSAGLVLTRLLPCPCPACVTRFARDSAELRIGAIGSVYGCGILKWYS